MTRNTLTEWLTGIGGDAVEWWMYYAAPDYVGIPGRFRYDDHGRVVFECEDGTALGSDTFEDGERFEPCEAPEPDPRIAALEAEVAALKASAEADAVSEYAAISALMAADPVLCRYGVLEAFQMLKARADDACGEPAPLRLGRGPTVEEAKAHADAQEDGHGWWLVSFDVRRHPDDEAIYFEIASIEVEDGEVFVDGMSSADGLRYTEITDAIPLNASRQPCGVGVKA